MCSCRPWPKLLLLLSFSFSTLFYFLSILTNKSLLSIFYSVRDPRSFPTRFVSILYFTSLKSHFSILSISFYKILLISLFILQYIILKSHKIIFSPTGVFPKDPNTSRDSLLHTLRHPLQRTPAYSLFPYTPFSNTNRFTSRWPTSAIIATIFSIFLLFSSNPWSYPTKTLVLSLNNNNKNNPALIQSKNNNTKINTNP